MGEGYTLAEVVEYGPIFWVADNNKTLINRNGSYLGLWELQKNGLWQETDIVAAEQDLYSVTAAQAWRECKTLAESLGLKEVDDDS